MLIGLSGKKRHGKDSFYNYLKELLPDMQVLRVSFADALKNEVYECVLKPHGLERDLLDKDETKAGFRTLLQWWGTDFKRKMFKDSYWLDLCKEYIQTLQVAFPNAIICVTDVRFPNEAAMISELDGINVRLVRPDFGEEDTHPSETALDDYKFDMVLQNSGSMEDYKRVVMRFCILQGLLRPEFEREEA
jgi:hypothetical protein